MHSITCHWIVTVDADGHRHLTEKWADWAAQQQHNADLVPVTLTEEHDGPTVELPPRNAERAVA